MRILCDHHVAAKYVQAFEQENWITVTRVQDILSPDAPDSEIVAYAMNNDWVVFTNDDDFYGETIPHGLLVYSQIEDPCPGDVVDACSAINDAYTSHDEIDEVVPDGWI